MAWIFAFSSSDWAILVCQAPGRVMTAAKNFFTLKGEE
jgi:hypothetical protein